MAAYNTLVLTDRASTPVDHTFTPDGFLNGQTVATFVKRNSDGVPVGDWRFSVAIRKTGNRTRPSLRLAVPIVATETVNGVDTPVVVRTAYANVDFNFDNKSSDQERADIVGMTASALAESLTQVDSAIVGLERIY
jgi:hypothetical protein